MIKNRTNAGRGDLYPQENCWGKEPIRGSIGSSCFFVRSHIFEKYIHHFAHERMGDFEFINKVWQSGVKCIWMDKQVSETFRVSRGEVE